MSPVAPAAGTPPWCTLTRTPVGMWIRLRGALNSGFSPQARNPRRTASIASAIVTTPLTASGFIKTGVIIGYGTESIANILQQPFGGDFLAEAFRLRELVDLAGDGEKLG